MKKIFISIASYRDPELESTIKNAIDNAEYPDNLYFGVVHQGLDKELPDLSFIKNKKIVSMHPRDARGAGFARSKAMELYDDEDYLLQIDSHMQFIKNWDTKLISELNLAIAKSNNEKIILSAFPGMYIREGKHAVLIPFHKGNEMTYPTKQKLSRRKSGAWASGRVEFESNDEYPEESNTVLAGFIFAPGKIVKEIPYDPEISFFGEELCFAARAWTNGWNIYSPKEFILYHFYGRNGYKKVWKDNSVRPISWGDIEKASENKQKNVLCGIEQGIYGLGSIRNIEDYEHFVGYNFKDAYNLTNRQD
jgi:hypothetical protein